MIGPIVPKGTILPDQPFYPGALMFFEPGPPRLVPDEGDLLRGVWDEIEAAERRIAKVSEVWRESGDCSTKASVVRVNGAAEVVVIPEPIWGQIQSRGMACPPMWLVAEELNRAGL